MNFFPVCHKNVAPDYRCRIPDCLFYSEIRCTCKDHDIHFLLQERAQGEGVAVGGGRCPCRRGSRDAHEAERYGLREPFAGRNGHHEPGACSHDAHDVRPSHDDATSSHDGAEPYDGKGQRTGHYDDGAGAGSRRLIPSALSNFDSALTSGLFRLSLSVSPSADEFSIALSRLPDPVEECMMPAVADELAVVPPPAVPISTMYIFSKG